MVIVRRERVLLEATENACVPLGLRMGIAATAIRLMDETRRLPLPKPKVDPEVLRTKSFAAKAKANLRNLVRSREKAWRKANPGQEPTAAHRSGFESTPNKNKARKRARKPASRRRKPDDAPPPDVPPTGAAQAVGGGPTAARKQADKPTKKPSKSDDDLAREFEPLLTKRKSRAKTVDKTYMGKNPMSGAPAKQVLVHSEFKKVRGILIPFKTDVLQDGKPLMEIELHSVKINSKIDLKLFENKKK